MKGRRRPLVLAVLACAIIVAAVTLGLRHLYRSSHDRLDAALGERLLAVAGSLALTLDEEIVHARTLGDTSTIAYLEGIRRRWREVAAASDLAEITLTDPIFDTVLISTSPGLPAGGPNDYWALDRAAVALAREGVAAASDLYPLGDVYQKSAHAPVMLHQPEFGAPEVAAVVTVSGSPDFFDTLAALRRAALLTGGAVLVVLAVVGTLLVRLDLSVQRYRTSLQRQENLAAMGRMTAGIAHEIRNPLGIIRGAGEHLQRVLAGAGISDEVADYIPEEVDRLDRILTGYLAFGRDDEAVAEKVDLATVARRGLALVRDEMASAGATVELVAPDEDLAVTGDPHRLQQVLLNLLLNARDAMADGGRVAVVLRADGDRAVLTVADEGPGLAASPDQCFEPFWTTKEKGGGLGLSLSRRLVEAMGGSLELRSRVPGPGAVAELRLPRSEPAETSV